MSEINEMEDPYIMSGLNEDPNRSQPMPIDASSTEPSMLATILSNIFLFFLIFGLSATVSVRNLKGQLSNKFALMTGIGMQFFVMPLLGFLSVVLFKEKISHAMAVTLLVVTSSPGGSYSNMWCSMFNADLALSVAMTAVSTILSIGLLPANLMLYSTLAFGKSEEVVQALDFGALFISLGIVIGAIVSGLATSYYIQSKTMRVWANRSGSISGIALILVSAYLSSGSETNFWSQPWEFYTAVAIPCMLGIFFANVLSRLVRLKKPETVAIAIECCYQNTGIATSIAVTMFSDPTDRAQAVSVPLFYGALEAVVIGLYCVWAWKLGWTKAPHDERICTVIAKSYEIDPEEMLRESPQESLARIEEEDDVESQKSVPPPAWWQVWKRRHNQEEISGDSLAAESASGLWCGLRRPRKAEGDESLSSRSSLGKTPTTLLPPPPQSRNRLTSEDNTVSTDTTSRNRGVSEDFLETPAALLAVTQSEIVPVTPPKEPVVAEYATVDTQSPGVRIPDEEEGASECCGVELLASGSFAKSLHSGGF